MKINIHELVEQVVKEEVAKLKEEAQDKPSFEVDPSYTHFALDKATNKILTGWDYKGLGRDEILSWTKGDLKDMEISPSSVSILGVPALKKLGIDPFNWDSWKKGTNEATTTMVTPDGKTLSPEQQAKMKTAKPGTTVVVKKAGELSEKKEEAPAEKDAAPVQDTTSSENISAQLNDHISAAIDAAAKCIQDTGDKKYEKVLGKVVKNLTAAQSALEDVQAHETKLAEQAAAEDEKSTVKYTQALRKALKGAFKNPEHIEQIIKKYNKVIKASKDKPAEKLAEMITAHALKEGFVVK